MRNEPIENRFWRKVEMIPESGCWIWVACLNKKGYGYFFKDKKTQLAHRVSYEMNVGMIPEGLQIDHLCRVRCCVNPAHLEAVTIQENIERGETGLLNRNKTHCPSNHEYTPENTWIKPSTGERKCRACRREYDRMVAS